MTTTSTFVERVRMTIFPAIRVPDSRLAQDVTDEVRNIGSPLLFNHSRRVYCFAFLMGHRQKLKFDPELLYLAAMFHDMGLMPKYRSAHNRFEVDGANAARDLLIRHHIVQSDVEDVWTAIALHTTRGIPQYMRPVVALLARGVEVDRESRIRPELMDADCKAILQGYSPGLKPNVFADLDPSFCRKDFCTLIQESVLRQNR
jgi:hypothetical protein